MGLPMNLRHVLCKGLTVLRMHDPDCDHCYVLQECWGIDMRKRLEELSKPEIQGKLGTPNLAGNRDVQLTTPTNVTPSNPEAPAEPRRKTG